VARWNCDFRFVGRKRKRSSNRWEESLVMADALMCMNCDKPLLPYFGPYGGERLWQCLTCNSTRKATLEELDLWWELFRTGDFLCPLCKSILKKKLVAGFNLPTLNCSNEKCKWWTYHFGSELYGCIEKNSIKRAHLIMSAAGAPDVPLDKKAEWLVKRPGAELSKIAELVRDIFPEEKAASVVDRVRLLVEAEKELREQMRGNKDEK
jgi:hypothetical protein